MLVRELLYVGLVPLLAAAIAAFASRRWANAPPVVWASGVAMGYVAGQMALIGRTGVARAWWSFARPHEAVDWLPHTVLLALGVAIFATYVPRKWRRWAVGLAFLLTIGLPLRLLAESAYVTHQWSILEKLSHLALLSAVFGLTWLVLASTRVTEQPRLRPALLIVVAIGSALTVALSAGLIYAELCGVLAAAVGGTWVAAYARGLSGASGVVSCSLGSLIVLSHFYAELTPTSATLLFVSLLLAAGRLPHFVSTWEAWQQIAARVGLCLVPLVFAVAHAALV
jgi:hypothetical protein